MTKKRQGDEPRRRSPLPPPSPRTPRPDSPQASPSPKKGLAQSGGSGGAVRRSPRLASKSPPSGAPAAENLPREGSGGRGVRWSGAEVLGESTGGGSAGDREAAGEGEDSVPGVGSLSDAGSFANLAPDGKIAPTEGGAQRRSMAAPGGSPSGAPAEVAVDLKEDADARGKGRKRPWREVRDAPEVGHELGGEDAEAASILMDYGDGAGAMEELVGASAKDQMPVLANDVKQEDNLDKLVPDAGGHGLSDPFSTAMEINRERYARLRDCNPSSSSAEDECTKLRIRWEPSKSNRCRPYPTLMDVCMKFLVDNPEKIGSMEGIPDFLTSRLMSMLCRVRKMSFQLLNLLVGHNWTKIYLSDCSWATEDNIQEIFKKCDTRKLEVVRLDLSGRCMPDYVCTTLARSSPMLTSLSLKGAYRLSDNGLSAIAISAPSLRSINISQCSLVTSLGIIELAEKLDCALRELYIDDCQKVDAMEILPALKKLQHLEVLSLAGLQSVCHKFVHGLIPSCGSDLREFCLARCVKVTDASINTISKHCPSLRVVDLRNLNQLTDNALKHLANGCRSLQTLKLRQTAFSDEAVAAFLEASGGFLIELMLNNMEQIAEHTALAISSRCRPSLQKLDLSFCREMTDGALGIIVDNCSCLKILKLFGVPKVTNRFLGGHSNSAVKVIGLKGQVLDNVDISVFF